MRNRLLPPPSMLAVALALLLGCHPAADTELLDMAHYEPIEKFVPAYEAIGNRADLATGRDYDIERTVRVLNALELAQANSENFDDFLTCMARQDYTGVAPDVLEAKAKLLPLLQYMYKLQDEDEQLGDVWMLARSAARGGASLVAGDGAWRMLGALHGNPFAIVDILKKEDAAHATDAAFEQYERDKELKSAIRGDIRKLRASYLLYLSDYAPIYHKYMREYDALCVEKDKAYIDLYAGSPGGALEHAQSILSKYPGNAEALLLKSLSLIMESPARTAGGAETVAASPLEVPLPDSVRTLPQPADGRLAAAGATLQAYTGLYPDRTAPALVLKGLLCQRQGDERGAMAYFDQAAMEYPRQAEQLTDMLDSYRARTYLNKTPEGQYLLRLYGSTMAGYGLFSPNLLKAKHYADRGEREKSQREIYNHFFRRGNQGAYDALLSDMQFCEDHLYGSFRQLLLEQSYVDVSVGPVQEWLFWRKDDAARVRVNNRSDVDLENVRVFLCIHYTDMYRDEYDVVKVPRTLGVVPQHSEADLGEVALDYGGKTFGDIAHVRAIVMTDDRICWVDDVDYKRTHALLRSRGGRRTADERLRQAKEDYLRNYSLEPEKLLRTLRDGVRIVAADSCAAGGPGWWNAVKGWFSRPDNRLRVELPRVVSMLDPVFSIRPIGGTDALAPVENYLDGTAIRLTFDHVPESQEAIPLYIYSDFMDFKVDILCEGAATEVVGVELLQ